MTCKQCGGATELVDETGGVENGRFREEYRCVACGATGTVTGKAEASPPEWTRVGRVFNA
jgi:transposase-like protein